MPTPPRRSTRTKGVLLVSIAGLLGAAWVMLNARDLTAVEVRALSLLPALGIGLLFGLPTYACRRRPREGKDDR